MRGVMKTETSEWVLMRIITVFTCFSNSLCLHAAIFSCLWGAFFCHAGSILIWPEEVLFSLKAYFTFIWNLVLFFKSYLPQWSRKCLSVISFQGAELKSPACSLLPGLSLYHPVFLPLCLLSLSFCICCCWVVLLHLNCEGKQFNKTKYILSPSVFPVFPHTLNFPFPYVLRILISINISTTDTNHLT